MSTLSPRASMLAPIGVPPPSNVFMTFTWHGRLRLKAAALAPATLTSWWSAPFGCLLRKPLTWGRAVCVGRVAPGARLTLCRRG